MARKPVALMLRTRRRRVLKPKSNRTLRRIAPVLLHAWLSQVSVHGASAQDFEPSLEIAPEASEDTTADATPLPPIAQDDARDAAILAAPEPVPAPTDGVAEALSDPLSIGGEVYMRLQASGLQGQKPTEYAFRTPLLLDLYLDARPNDRVRAFVLGRMTYDPTLPHSAASEDAATWTANSAVVEPVFGAPTSGPDVALDQFWLRFDIGRALFVTLGKQHVRWGTGHFWSPTDYLHLRPRDPLDLFDIRTGTTMLKLHLPIESLAWNLYAYALFEGEEPIPTPERVAAAARAEIVVATAELGLGVYGRKDAMPKFAADLSIGIGDFDLYGEVSAQDSAAIDRVSYAPLAPIPPPIAPLPSQSASEVFHTRLTQITDALYPLVPQTGYRVAVVGGLSLSINYTDSDAFTLGLEYFYNQFGYEHPDVYLGLMLPHSRPLRDPATFFYLGQHYGAAYLSFPSPFSLDLHSFMLSALANFSDKSYIARLDYTVTILTYLRLEVFVAAHLGSFDGEFRFGIHPINLEGFVLSRSPAVLDIGVSLRVSI